MVSLDTPERPSLKSTLPFPLKSASKFSNTVPGGAPSRLGTGIGFAPGGMSTSSRVWMLILLAEATATRDVRPRGVSHVRTDDPFDHGAAGSGILPQLTSRAYDTASSGTPLLSPSTMKGESHASPLPSLSWSAWRKVLGMIGGFATVGQSSMASGTPSLSTSSFTNAHPPVLTTPSFWQVSPAQTPPPPAHGRPTVGHVVPLRLQVKMQGRLPVGFKQSLVGSSEQTPTLVGQSASVEQMWSLLRLQLPGLVPVNVMAVAPAQSPSQASPIPSRSESVCRGFGVRTQLSGGLPLSLKPSPSRSVFLSQATPLPP